MTQRRWISLERYGLIAGFRVFGAGLFPVIEGGDKAISAASAVIEGLGFRKTREGGYAGEWKNLPTPERWLEAFPAATFVALEDVAGTVALGGEAREHMVKAGLVTDDAFVSVGRDEPQSTAQAAARDGGRAEGRDTSGGSAKVWRWLNLEAYGLEVVVRMVAGESQIRVEGPSAAKHLIKDDLLAHGAVVEDGLDGGISIIIPKGAGSFDMPGLLSSMPLAKVESMPVGDITVRQAEAPEPARLNLSDRLDREVFSQLVQGRLADGVEKFDQAALVELGAKVVGVSPSLMRSEFGITDRALQEQLESSLGEVFALNAYKQHGSEELIEFGSMLDRMMPREKASTGSSKALQQFSTPLSISAAVQTVIGLGPNMSVWEPTAGNASLVALATPADVKGLELDEERVKNLHAKGYTGVRRGDAVSGSLGAERFPRVVMNPPFGAFGDGQGRREFKSDVPGPNGGTPPFIKTTAQDKYIALRHLDKLDENGVGAIIVGADHPMRFKSGEYSDETRQFLSFLCDTYNVLDLRYVEGKMYASHGAGWPLLLIITGDKRDELGSYNLPDTLPVISNLEQLKAYTGIAREKVRAYEEERAVDSVRARNGDSGRGPGAGERDEDDKPSGEEGVKGSLPAQEQEIEDEVEQTQVEAGEEEAEGWDEEVDDTRQRHAVDPDEKDVPYQPRSQMASLDKRIPANLATPIGNALDRVERANGDIDTFVANELGWSIEELGNALAAEQVDAVALALYQAQLGKGFILGDNTGIGKGRVVATLAAWGIRHGHKPIFCTSKADLFGDIMRDFQDIGEAELIKPLVMNDLSKDIVMADTGQVVVKRTPRSVVQSALKAGDIPSEYNAVFMTYSQVNREIHRCKKAQWLQKVADGNVLLFDEVHNASGPDSNTGANVRDAVRVARFTLGSSATYAKRPDNLGLYEFTSMFDGNDPDSVIESVTLGGPEYQEVLSTMLAESGQLIARAHEPPPPPQAIVVNPEYKEGYDSLEFSDRLAQVLDAMTAVAEEAESIVNSENERIREMVKALPKESQAGLSSWKSQSVHFASQMHHIVRVANYAAKADAIIEEVVLAVEQGRRPLVAVEGTMEAFLRGAYQSALLGREAAREAEAERLGVELSEIPIDTSPIIADLTYRDTIKNFLDRMLIIKRTDRYGNESEEPIVDVAEYLAVYRKEQEGLLEDDQLALEDLIMDHLSKESITSDQANTLRYYFSVLGLIEQLPNSLPASPIDYVRDGLARRGIKMGELTGRSLGLDYSTETGIPEFRVRGGEELNRRLQADRFNNGDVQSLIFNSAAAEGVSLHAHKDFKNNEDRRTLFWQVPGDINVYTQMAGRTHRSGAREGASPDFRVICLDTPIEDRMMANLEQKEGSLKANTKADRETGIAMRSEPMMNRVGDLVTWEVLRQHPQSKSICKRLGIELDSEIEKFSQSGVKDKTGSDTGLFSKVTGRLCRMMLAESRPLLEQMEEAFRERVEHLDRQGMNPLKTQIHDLRASLVGKREIFPRSGPSAFESEVVAQEVTYTDYIKPITLEEVQAQIAKTHESLALRGMSSYPMKDLWVEIESSMSSRLLREFEHNGKDLFESLPGNSMDKLEQAKNIVRAQPNRFPEETVRERFQRFVAQEDLMRKLRDLLGVGAEIKNFPVGAALLDCDVKQDNMVVSRIIPPMKGSNPALPGQWRIRLESPNPEVGRFELSLNQLMHVMREHPTVKVSGEPLEASELADRFHANRHPQSIQRGRWVIMGNLPKGYSMAVSNSSFSSGKPGVFTTESGQKLRGIIMPRDFDASALRRLMDSDFTISTFEAVTAYIDRKESESYHPVIYTAPAKQMEQWAKRENKTFHPGRGAMLVKDADTLEWKLRISAVKKHSDGYMSDGKLLNLLDGDFATVSSLGRIMEAPVPREHMDEVVKRLMLAHNQTFHGDGADADWYREFMRERGRRLIQEQAANVADRGEAMSGSLLHEDGPSLTSGQMEPV